VVEINRLSKDSLMHEPFTAIMQNLLSLCYSFQQDNQAGLKMWVLAEKMLNQLCLQKQNVGAAAAAPAAKVIHASVKQPIPQSRFFPHRILFVFVCLFLFHFSNHDCRNWLLV
jgi:hypothetical protein